MNLSGLDAAGRREKAQEERADIEEAFAKFDSQGDGYLRPADVRRVLLALGLRLTDSELLEVVQQADENGDGLIDFQEFLKMMMKDDPSTTVPVDPKTNTSRTTQPPARTTKTTPAATGLVSLDSIFSDDKNSNT